MTVWQFFLAVLTVFRVSSLLVHEDGPKAIFRRLREKAAGSEFFHQLLSCVWCTSVWIAGFYIIAFLLIPQVVYWVSLWLSLSSGVILVQQLARNDIGNAFLRIAEKQEAERDLARRMRGSVPPKQSALMDYAAKDHLDAVAHSLPVPPRTYGQS